MIYVLTTIHVIVCIFLIIVVLIQSGKSADLAGAFGGTGSQSTFGPRGAASALAKATTAAVILFMLTSMTLSIMASRRSSAIDSVFHNTTPSKPMAPSNSTTGPAQNVPVQPSSIPAPAAPKK